MGMTPLRLNVKKEYFKIKNWAELHNKFAMAGISSSYFSVPKWNYQRKYSRINKKTMKTIEFLIPHCTVHPYRFHVLESEEKLFAPKNEKEANEIAEKIFNVKKQNDGL